MKNQLTQTSMQQAIKTDLDKIATLRGVLAALLLAQSRMQRASDWYPGQTLRDFENAIESARVALRETE